MKAQLLKDLSQNITQLEKHTLYEKINSKKSLSFFMERHAFAVFDFMSLVKYLQHEFAPTILPWTPPSNIKLARFLNEIVLAEESDLDLQGSPISHFELYLKAMEEVDANIENIGEFINGLGEYPLGEYIENSIIPMSAKRFMGYTFSLLSTGKTHEIAAAFCFGREKVIPLMFQSLLDKMDVPKEKASNFYYYLERHIEIDGDSHGPLALEMLDVLCAGDERKWSEVKIAAMASIGARVNFWNDVEQEMELAFKGQLKTDLH